MLGVLEKATLAMNDLDAVNSNVALTIKARIDLLYDEEQRLLGVSKKRLTSSKSILHKIVWAPRLSKSVKELLSRAENLIRNYKDKWYL